MKDHNQVDPKDGIGLVLSLPDAEWQHLQELTKPLV